MPELNVNDLAQAKKATAVLALFALTEELLFPSNPTCLAEAWRVLTTESDELKSISKLLEIDFYILRKNVFRYLEKSGIEGKFYL